MAIGKEKSMQIQEKRREQILEAARVLFDQNGFKNTKISDISKAVGISKGLVYHYYQSKEDILLALTDSMNECLDELSAFDSPIESLKEFAVRLLTAPSEASYIPPLRIFVTVSVRGELDDEEYDNPITKEFGREYFAPIFRKGQQMGQFRAGDAEEFADFYWHYLLGCLVRFLQNKGKESAVPDLNAALNIFR